MGSFNFILIALYTSYQVAEIRNSAPSGEPSSDSEEEDEETEKDNTDAVISMEPMVPIISTSAGDAGEGAVVANADDLKESVRSFANESSDAVNTSDTEEENPVLELASETNGSTIATTPTTLPRENGPLPAVLLMSARQGAPKGISTTTGNETTEGEAGELVKGSDVSKEGIPVARPEVIIFGSRVKTESDTAVISSNDMTDVGATSTATTKPDEGGLPLGAVATGAVSALLAAASTAATVSGNKEWDTGAATSDTKEWGLIMEPTTTTASRSVGGMKTAVSSMASRSPQRQVVQLLNKARALPEFTTDDDTATGDDDASDTTTDGGGSSEVKASTPTTGCVTTSAAAKDEKAPLKKSTTLTDDAISRVVEGALPVGPDVPTGTESARAVIKEDAPLVDKEVGSNTFTASGNSDGTGIGTQEKAPIAENEIATATAVSTSTRGSDTDAKEPVVPRSSNAQMAKLAALLALSTYVYMTILGNPLTLPNTLLYAVYGMLLALVLGDRGYGAWGAGDIVTGWLVLYAAIYCVTKTSKPFEFLYAAIWIGAGYLGAGKARQKFGERGKTGMQSGRGEDLVCLNFFYIHIFQSCMKASLLF